MDKTLDTSGASLRISHLRSSIFTSSLVVVFFVIISAFSYLPGDVAQWLHWNIWPWSGDETVERTKWEEVQMWRFYSGKCSQDTNIIFWKRNNCEVKRVNHFGFLKQQINRSDLTILKSKARQFSIDEGSVVTSCFLIHKQNFRSKFVLCCGSTSLLWLQQFGHLTQGSS